jgi:tellurite resistance protein
MRAFLEKFPISIFSVTMGTFGTALLSLKMGLPYSNVLYLFWGLTGTIIFVLSLIVYLLKVVSVPNAVYKEFMHPISLQFFATFTIGAMLLSKFLSSYFSWGTLLILIFTVFHLILTLMIMAQWIRQTSFEIHHMNPSWFIPIVGTVIGPLVGKDVLPLWFNVFLVSVGTFFYVVIGAILMYRIIFHHPLPDRLVPTFVIFIAPPSAIAITISYLLGVQSYLGIFFYGIAVFFLMLLLFLVDMFFKLKYELSWWAYTFPVAIFGNATMTFKEILPWLNWLGIVVYVVLNIIVFGLLFVTLARLINGKLFVEPAPKVQENG